MAKGNKHPLCKFPKAPQGLNEAKSRGQVARAKDINILSHIRTNIEDRDIINKVFDIAEEQLKQGITKASLELIKIAKENENQNLLVNGNVGIQKVFITEKEHQETMKHIDAVINEQ